MRHRRFLFRNRSSDRHSTQGVSFAISPDFASLTLSGQVPTSTGGTLTPNPANASLVLTTFAPIANLTQVAHPSADVSTGLWVASTGSSLYTTLDEIVADDSDYDYTPNPSTMEVRFSSLIDPVSSSSHTVSYRIKGDGASTVTVSLRQGSSTVISSWSHSPAPSTFTTYQQTLSGTEADSITDYTDLRLRVVAA